MVAFQFTTWFMSHIGLRINIIIISVSVTCSEVLFYHVNSISKLLLIKSNRLIIHCIVLWSIIWLEVIAFWLVYAHTILFLKSSIRRTRKIKNKLINGTFLPTKPDTSSMQAGQFISVLTPRSKQAHPATILKKKKILLANLVLLIFESPQNLLCTCDFVPRLRKHAANQIINATKLQFFVLLGASDQYGSSEERGYFTWQMFKPREQAHACVSRVIQYWVLQHLQFENLQLARKLLSFPILKATNFTYSKWVNAW